ncbi:MAG TPA: anthranilate synthase component I [Verrucomicrobiota bacterium]|nr:anthranilate synthase component I [Verrucomicrobiota bacterium]
MFYPEKQEFVELSKKGNLIPVALKLLADFETPLSAYTKIRGKSEAFLLESVEGGERIGRYSFVGCNPAKVIRQIGNQVEVKSKDKIESTYTVVQSPKNKNEVRDGLEVIQKIMARYKPVLIPGLPRFSGGAVGYIGYEFIHDIEPVVPRPPNDELKTPVIYFLIAGELLVFDRATQTLTILVNVFTDNYSSPDKAYDDAVEKIKRIMAILQKPVSSSIAIFSDKVPDVSASSNTPKEKFIQNVLKAKQYIISGDIIQVVGSQRFKIPIKTTAIDVYRAARSINPSPYMFLLELDGFSLVGASPETHVRCEDGLVEIRPIAGTRSRGKSDEEDLALEKELLADPKERAEHVMLVDLARNDIGRVCDFGSVKVQDLMIIEKYSHVMHIVSDVKGKLSLDKSIYDLMRATFPAGTLTGAPKIRAMQIISELEQTSRGPYGGCVGYFSFTGNLDCCITIRTALIKDGFAYVQAGGGWVADSNPEAEYMETINKSKAMIKAVALAEHFQNQTNKSIN